MMRLSDGLMPIIDPHYFDEDPDKEWHRLTVPSVTDPTPGNCDGNEEHKREDR
jgi:hypothetical protein